MRHDAPPPPVLEEVPPPPPPSLDHTVFERPLKWLACLPHGEGGSGAGGGDAAASAPPSTEYRVDDYPCMFICSKKARKTSLPLTQVKVVKRKGKGKGKKMENGYLNVLTESTPVGAHRAVLALIIGPPPASSPPHGRQWLCCHTCSQPTCLQPFHLVWGDTADNKRDDPARYIELSQVAMRRRNEPFLSQPLIQSVPSSSCL